MERFAQRNKGWSVTGFVNGASKSVEPPNDCYNGIGWADNSEPLERWSSPWEGLPRVSETSLRSARTEREEWWNRSLACSNWDDTNTRSDFLRWQPLYSNLAVQCLKGRSCREDVPRAQDSEIWDQNDKVRVLWKEWGARNHFGERRGFWRAFRWETERVLPNTFRCWQFQFEQWYECISAFREKSSSKKIDKLIQ